jgi:hypothetical protein
MEILNMEILIIDKLIISFLYNENCIFIRKKAPIIIFLRQFLKQINTQKTGEKEQAELSFHLLDNLKMLQAVFVDCTDVVFRSFSIGENSKACLIYIDGLSNSAEIDERVLTPLMIGSLVNGINLEEFLEKKIFVSKIKHVTTLTECITHIFAGSAILLIDQANQAYSLGLNKWEKRSIEEPAGEQVLRGPREGFTESIGVNTSMLRRKLKTPHLKLKSLKVGRYSQTEITIAYVDKLASQSLIDEVIKRIQRIEIDGVLESTYIEEFIEDNPFSPFPQVLNSERPDVAAANLLEGRVVILIDGTPTVLIVPITFYSLIQSTEDYYQRYMFATAIRFLRFLSLIVALLLPSIYVAVITFHQEMVPRSLLLSMAASREPVPFPALIEALIMEVTFEVLREAGLRLPKQMGSAVSIVGALVIGQAAVQAGLVSAPMVMVVALTGIASFVIPRYSVGFSLRLLRFPIILLAGTLGLLGIMLSVFTIIIHLCRLRSFGVPYLSPMAPLERRELKDVLIRAPWRKMYTRPHLTGEADEYRMDVGQKPPPQKE